jgi:protein-S-isoprenylcysteine O-methyltransferase Ste14
MATLRRNILISATFILFGGPGILLVLIPWLITRFRLSASQPLSQSCLAVFLIAIGLIPLLDSITRFIVIGRGTLVPTTPTERLVVSGLYRFVRNPMYLGVLITLCGEALLFQSTGILIEMLAVAILVDLFVRLYEEPRLTSTFGDEYLHYKRHVRRWIPRLSPWHRSHRNH